MKEYNTAINPLGSLPDINIIFETIKFYAENRDLEGLKKEFIDGNVFGFQLSSSRKRFFSLLKKLYLNNEGKDFELFLKAISNQKSVTSLKKAAIYIETCRNNDLFFDIINGFIYPKYKEDRRLVTSSELYDFLTEFSEGSKIEEWSDSTIKTISYKFIKFMKRLGYFEKETRVKSLFSFPYPTVEVVTYIVYLLKAEGKTDDEIYNSDLFRSLMLNKQDKISLLKEGAVKNFYEFSLSGSGNAEFQLNYSGGEIIDEFFKQKY
ncbi:MAG: BrxA family protein [Bacillota bacterium]